MCDPNRILTWLEENVQSMRQGAGVDWVDIQSRGLLRVRGRVT